MTTLNELTECDTALGTWMGLHRCISLATAVDRAIHIDALFIHDDSEEIVATVSRCLLNFI